MKSERTNNNVNLGLQLNRVFDIEIKKIKANINGMEVGLVKNNKVAIKIKTK